jgi:hypothetical protein
MSGTRDTGSGQHLCVIRLEPGDDVAIIRDRLEWAEAQHVVLVVPPGNRALRRLVNLTLVARHARNTGRRVALVTNHPRVVQLSREAGLATFGSIERAESSSWLTPSPAADRRTPEHTSVTAHEEVVELDEVPGVSLPERPHKQVVRPKRLPVFRREAERRLTGLQAVAHRALSAFGFLSILAFLAALMGVVLLLLVPEGRIELTAKRVPVHAELTMRANPKVEQVDYATLDIPARLVQVELRDTGRIAPTGASDLPTERAVGATTFMNRTAQEVMVPINTTVSTSSGTTVRFLTSVTTTVPAALNASVVVTITAVDPGPIGNVGAGQINKIDDSMLARRLAVINETPTHGGMVATAGVVTRVDKDRLWSIVLQQMYQEGYGRLVADLAEQEFIPPESVVVLPLEGTFTPSLDGEQTDQLLLDMRAVVRGTAIGGQHANQLALAALQAETPAAHKLDPRSLQFVMGQVIGVNEDQAVSFDMEAAGEAVAQFDTGQLTSQVRGMPVEEARRLLGQQLPLAGEPLVTVQPDWLGRMPWLPFRINVTVVE